MKKKNNEQSNATLESKKQEKSFVDNVKDFLSSGFMSAGVGSHIINAKKIAAGDFDGVRNAAKGFVAAIK